MDLTQASDDHLQAEVERRAKIRLEEKRKAVQQHQDFVMKNVDVLLLLVPKHDRTSCNDSDPCNAYDARCTRCTLLYAKNNNFLDEGIVIRVQVGVSD